MRYHLFQKVFEKMVKIKETSFLLSKCLVSIAHHCSDAHKHAPHGLRVTKNAYFSVLPHIKQLLLVTFYATLARTGSVMVRQINRTWYGQTDLNIEIVM